MDGEDISLSDIAHLVTNDRLNRILSLFRGEVGTEHVPIVIEAMIKDIANETRVRDKAARSTISKLTATLFLDRTKPRDRRST